MILDWLVANIWVAWLAAAALLALGEMATLDLTLLMIALGCLAGAGVAFVLPGLIAAQIGAAIVVALALLLVLRPPLLAKVRGSSPGYRNSADNLLGSEGLAIAEITPTAGEVKIGGEVWSARSYDGTPIAAGTPVEVLEIDGVVVKVYPQHKPLASA